MKNRRLCCLDDVLRIPNIHVVYSIDANKPVLWTSSKTSVKRFASKIYGGYSRDAEEAYVTNALRNGGVPLNTFIFTCKHKYGEDRYYKGYVVYDSRIGKSITLLESCLVWMYYHPDERILPFEDIDHIDGNPLNNDISNLQKITRTENLAKRKGAKNQFEYI